MFLKAQTKLRSDLFLYLSIYLAWLILLFISTGGLNDFSAWLTSWSKWDAQWYQQIWQQGYPQDDPRTLVFPPGYPILVGVLSNPLRLDFAKTALIVNVFSFFISCVLAAELLGPLISVPALAIFCLTLTSPMAYFVFASYSDSVFNLIFWGVLTLAIRKPSSLKSRCLEVVLLFSAPWIRLTGYAFASWLLLRKWSALVVFVSLAGWLSLNFLITGHAFYFLDSQQLFIMRSGHFLDGLGVAVQGLFFPSHISGLVVGSTDYFQFYFLPVLYLIGLTTTSLWLLYRKQWLMGISILAILFISHNQSFWRSAVRYDWPLLPFLYTGVLRLSFFRSAVFAGILLATLALLNLFMQIYFANLFKAGFWAF
jgi:hypothetical protein